MRNVVGVAAMLHPAVGTTQHWLHVLSGTRGSAIFSLPSTFAAASRAISRIADAELCADLLSRSRQNGIAMIGTHPLATQVARLHLRVFLPGHPYAVVVAIRWRLTGNRIDHS
jgi:hypothetical protein